MRKKSDSFEGEKLKLSESITIIAAFGALFFSIYSHNQMLVRDEPRVTFAEPSLILTEDGNYRLSYALINMGETETGNVKIKFSTCDGLKCPYVLFDDELLNILDPHISHTFGFSNFDCADEMDCIDKIKESFLFIVDLEYGNPLRTDPSKRRFYYFWTEETGLVSALKKDICAKANEYGIDSEFKKYLTFCL